MLSGGARNLWSEQPLALRAEDVITGLEFLVDLPMGSLVDQQENKKNDIYHPYFLGAPKKRVRTLKLYQTRPIFFCVSVILELIFYCMTANRLRNESNTTERMK